MQKLTTCLWFNGNAEEAVKFYTSVFKNSKIDQVSYYGEGMPFPKDTVLTITFQINGQDFMALNGGPEYTFTPAISLVVNCTTQDEVDYYWDRLSAGGAEIQCGWLVDKFGLSWQVVPTILSELLQDKNREKANRVLQAMLQMKKIEINSLKKAYEKV